MPRNNLHSFTLDTGASKAIRSVRRGSKSKFVSRCVNWFTHFHCTDWTDGEGKLWRSGTQIKPQFIDQRIQDFLEAHEQLLENHKEVCIENAKLREELQKNESFISKMLKLFGK
ncbi:MAG: hypothetical protein [Circular genetic element sp.]|jgi:hypothetical protein|nr:MAG: hypothetical protein [Circular genetic element sp.]